MTKFILLILVSLISLSCRTVPGKANSGFDTWKVTALPLPAEIIDAERQFSGLAISNGTLYLLPECRLQELHEAVIFTAALEAMMEMSTNNSSPLVFKKHPLYGLEYLVDKITKQGQDYEGIEAIAVKGNQIFLSLETATDSPDCFVIRGDLKDGTVQLDTSLLLPLAKPFDVWGHHVYNAGFEAIVFYKQRLYCFFEYNAFPNGNFVYHYNSDLNPASKDSIQIDPIPFRVTDLAMSGTASATAINFFYQGGGADTVYRPSATDVVNYQMVHDSIVGFRSFARLLKLNFRKNRISYKPMKVIPDFYRAYNWEGIAPYKKGYFLINDKYTPIKPYRTLLIYIAPE